MAMLWLLLATPALLLTGAQDFPSTSTSDARLQQLEARLQHFLQQQLEDRQRWDWEKQALESYVKTLHGDLQALADKVRALEASQRSSETSGSASLATHQAVEKRSDNMQTLDIKPGGENFNMLEVSDELHKINSTFTHSMEQVQSELTTCQTVLATTTQDLDLLRQEVNTVKQAAASAMLMASQREGADPTLGTELQTLKERVEELSVTLENELAIIIKVLNTKVDSEVAQLSSSLLSNTQTMYASLATANLRVQEALNQTQAMDKRVSSLDYRVSRIASKLTHSKHSTFTRWGTAECPRDTTTVYSGKVAGGSSDANGTSGSFACLLTPPDANATNPEPQPQRRAAQGQAGERGHISRGPGICTTTPWPALCARPRSRTP